MKTTIRTLIAIAFLLPACFASAPPAPPPQSSGLVEGKPSPNLWPVEEPGETQPAKTRAYELAPPVVPHSVYGQFITRRINDCFECHQNGDEIEEGHKATKIPVSHYENPFSSEKITDRYRVEGTRYVCTQCHVHQTSGEPRGMAERPVPR